MSARPSVACEAKRGRFAPLAPVAGLALNVFDGTCTFRTAGDGKLGVRGVAE